MKQNQSLILPCERKYQLLLLTMCVFLIAGCKSVGTGPRQTVIANFSSALVQVDRPKLTKTRYGKMSAIKQDPDKKYTYKDRLFSGVFYVSNSRINFMLTNKTDHSIKIIWDEASFIDLNGESVRISHNGVKYIDRNNSQPPTIIPKKASLTDFAIPTNRIHYREGSYSQYYSSPGGWEEIGIVVPNSRFETSNPKAIQWFSSKMEKYKGRKFGLLLPLKIEGVINEYTFWFEVQDVSIRGYK